MRRGEVLIIASRFLLIVLLSLLQFRGATGFELASSSHCPMLRFRTVFLVYNETSGSYQLPDESGETTPTEDLEANNTSTRFLRYPTSSNESVFEVSYDNIQFEESTKEPALAVSLYAKNRWTQTTTTGSTAPQGSLEVRPCGCADPRRYPEIAYFCPLSKSYCFVPFALGGEQVLPTCVNETSQRATTKALWPIVVVWMSLLVICIVCSIPGRNAIDCCINLPFPFWNRIVANVMLRRNPERAHFMIHRAYFRRRRVLEQRYLDMLASNPEEAAAVTAADEATANNHRPTKLSLKTCIYQSEHLEDSDTGDDSTCPICLAPIETGDRVGALKCSHIFHVECLKEWLKRGRNVCPLCMQTDVAAAQYDTVAASEQASTQATTDGGDVDEDNDDDGATDADLAATHALMTDAHVL